MCVLVRTDGCLCSPAFNAQNQEELDRKVRAGYVNPLPDCYSPALKDFILSMLDTNADRRPTTRTLLKNLHVRLARKTHELARTQASVLQDIQNLNLREEAMDKYETELRGRKEQCDVRESRLEQREQELHTQLQEMETKRRSLERREQDILQRELDTRHGLESKMQARLQDLEMRQRRLERREQALNHNPSPSPIEASQPASSSSSSEGVLTPRDTPPLPSAGHTRPLRSFTRRQSEVAVDHPRSQINRPSLRRGLDNQGGLGRMQSSPCVVMGPSPFEPAANLPPSPEKDTSMRDASAFLADKENAHHSLAAMASANASLAKHGMPPSDSLDKLAALASAPASTASPMRHDLSQDESLPSPFLRKVQRRANPPLSRRSGLNKAQSIDLRS